MLTARERLRTTVGLGALALAVACSNGPNTTVTSGTNGNAATTAGTSGALSGSSSGSGSATGGSSSGSSTTSSTTGGTTGSMPDSGCGCDAGTFCDPSGTSACLQCLTDADCTGAQKVCQNSLAYLNYGQCVGCTIAEPTCASGLLCDLSFGETYQTCVPDCRLDAGVCGVLYCSHISGTCTRQCTADADCPTTLPRCQVGSGRCLQCLSPDDCLYSQAGCLTNVGVCGGCVTDDNCPTGTFCDLNDANCTCTASQQCGGNAPICIGLDAGHGGIGADAGYGGYCGCGSTADCAPNGGVCAPGGLANACIFPCTDGGTDCSIYPPGSIYCDASTGLCGPCSQDSQCTGDDAGPRCLSDRVCGCIDQTDCTTPNVCGPNYANGTPDLACIPSCAIAGGTDCNPYRQICLTDTGLCGPCSMNSQCDGDDAGPYCGPGRCVQCLVAQDCPGVTPGCNSMSFVCGSCLTPADCPTGLPNCLGGGCIAGCVLVDGGTHCDTGVCQTTTSLCVDCVQDSDCSPPLPYCTNDIGAGTSCAECVQGSDCDGGLCNGQLFTCGSCAFDGDCPPAAPFCTSLGTCSATDGGM